MNDNLIIMGINAPRLHQKIITHLIYGLTQLFKTGQSKYFAYPETMIDEGQTSPVPDIMLVDPTSDLTQVIIEITHTQGVKKDIEKLKNLMKDYGVPEGFVFDYKRSEWHHFRLLDGSFLEDNSSLCHSIGADLDNLLS